MEQGMPAVKDKYIDIPYQFFLREKPENPPTLKIRVFALTKNKEFVDDRVFLPVVEFTMPDVECLCSSSGDKNIYSNPLVLMVDLELIR